MYQFLCKSICWNTVRFRTMVVNFWRYKKSNLFYRVQLNEETRTNHQITDDDFCRHLVSHLLIFFLLFSLPARPPRAQSLQPSSTKGPPPPVAPKPGKCMKSNPRPKLSMGDEQLPVHYRSSSDQLRLVSPGDPYHDASGYCSDVDHRTKAYAFKKPGMFRPTPYFAGPRMSQPVPYSLPGSDLWEAKR